MFGSKFRDEFQMVEINLQDRLQTSQIDLGNFLCFCWLQYEIKTTSQFTVLFVFRLKFSAQSGKDELSIPENHSPLLYLYNTGVQFFLAKPLKMFISSYMGLHFKLIILSLLWHCIVKILY